MGIIALAASSEMRGAISTQYDSGTGSIAMTIGTIQALAVTAPSAISLVVNDATPGSAPSSVSDATSSYAISTNVSTSLTVSGASIPTGVNFVAQLGASGSLAATGSITLKSAAGAGGTVTLFSSIAAGFYNGTVTYTVSAPIATNPLTNQSFQLPYTLQ